MTKRIFFAMGILLTVSSSSYGMNRLDMVWVKLCYKDRSTETEKLCSIMPTLLAEAQKLDAGEARQGKEHLCETMMSMIETCEARHKATQLYSLAPGKIPVVEKNFRMADASLVKEGRSIEKRMKALRNIDASLKKI